MISSPWLIQSERSWDYLSWFIIPWATSKARPPPLTSALDAVSRREILAIHKQLSSIIPAIYCGKNKL